MRKIKRISTIILLGIMLAGCGAQTEGTISKKDFAWLEQDIPSGYEKVWESEQDEVLLEVYNPQDDGPSLLGMTNKGSVDIDVDADFKMTDINGTEYLLSFGTPNKLCAGHTYTQLHYTQVNPETITGDEESYIHLNEEDTALKNGISFEVTGWDEEISLSIRPFDEFDIEKDQLMVSYAYQQVYWE